MVELMLTIYICATVYHEKYAEGTQQSSKRKTAETTAGKLKKGTLVRGITSKNGTVKWLKKIWCSFMERYIVQYDSNAPRVQPATDMNVLRSSMSRYYKYN